MQNGRQQAWWLNYTLRTQPGSHGYFKENKESLPAPFFCDRVEPLLAAATTTAAAASSGGALDFLKWGAPLSVAIVAAMLPRRPTSPRREELRSLLFAECPLFFFDGGAGSVSTKLEVSSRAPILTLHLQTQI